MTVTHLLDAHVLIALVVADHEHHQRTSRWAAGAGQIAVSPVVEGALVRFFLRVGESPRVAQEVLHRLHALPQCSFWPDTASYADLSLAHVQGHRQVTDAYLVGLCAQRQGALLATLDEALSRELPGLTTLVPEV